MAGIIESIKKLYTGENYKKNHLILFAICFLYMLFSSAFDVMTARAYSLKQNPFDFVFGFFISVYALKYVHNCINNINEGELPALNEINPASIVPLIIVNIVWGLYMALAVILGIIVFWVTKSIIITLIIGIIVFLAATLFQFIYIALAENYNAKGILNITLIFKFIKPAFKPFWISAIKTTLLSAALLGIYIALYFMGLFFGFDVIFPIAKGYNLFDTILIPAFVYAFIALWYFAFPRTLIDTYREKIRPIIHVDTLETSPAKEGDAQ